MNQYDIRETIAEYELDKRIPAGQWDTDEQTAEEIRFVHPAGHKVILVQRKEIGSGLAFKAFKQSADEQGRTEIDEGDYPTDVWPAVAAYMIGVEEPSE